MGKSSRFPWRNVIGSEIAAYHAEYYHQPEFHFLLFSAAAYVAKSLLNVDCLTPHQPSLTK
jgi:hypothetical protein